MFNLRIAIINTLLSTEYVMEEQPKPLNVVTVELHNIVFANGTLQCYKWIYFADLTQNW